MKLIFPMLAALASHLGMAAAEPVTFSERDGTLHVKSGESSLSLNLAAPVFTLKDMPPTQAKAGTANVADLADGKVLEIPCPPAALPNGGTLETVGCWQWSAGENILRQWARYKLEGAGATLMEVTLNEMPSDGISLYGALAPQSSPAFGRGFFAGVEYPVAATRIAGDKLVLAHRPGVPIEPGAWHETRKAVYGLTPMGGEVAAFQDYIQSHRPAPHALHINYNGWWTMPAPYSEKDVLDLMGAFEENLFQANGAAFDTFTIDDGWSNPKSVWEISGERFPQGFANIKSAAERMKSHLGLWISPTSCYSPHALDNEWAATQGYETLPRIREYDGFKQVFSCLGGPKYAAAFKRQLMEMAVKQGVRHFKLDGYALTCPEKNHGHEPDAYSGESMAAGGIAAFEAVRQAVPEVWLETTCFGWNPSPWWLFYVNSVVGAYGDDAPPGRAPAPVYRESATSGRDYFNLQGAAWLPFPDTAQEVMGMVHQTDEPFLNDGVTFILRGHFFAPLYVNPKYMNPLRWRQLAGLINWARRNEETLSRTDPFLPAAWRGKTPKFDRHQPMMPREPYGYLHPTGKGGLVYLRNPWVEKQTVRLDLARDLKVAPGTVGLSAVSLYPDVRLYGEGLNAQGAVEVPLAPYETVVLSIAPDQKTAGVKPAGEAIGHHLKTADMKTSLKRVVLEGSQPAMGPDWTAQMGNTTEALELTLEGQIETGDCEAELLVLFEGAPKTRSPSIGFAKWQVNGRDVPMTITPSDVQWKSTNLPEMEAWTFAAGKLDPGKNDVRLVIMGDANAAKVSCWAWAFRKTDGETPDHPNALPMPECLYLDSASLLKEISPATIQETEKRSSPVEKTDGVYLDSLKPVSAVQGWGRLQLNRSVWEKPLAIGGKSFRRGLGTHAPAKIVYDIPAGSKRFAASVGADSANDATVDFEVLADGRSLWKSGPVDKNAGVRTVDVDITDAKQLELRVGDGGNGMRGDHADVCDARFLRN